MAYVKKEKILVFSMLCFCVFVLSVLGVVLLTVYVDVEDNRYSIPPKKEDFLLC